MMRFNPEDMNLYLRSAKKPHGTARSTFRMHHLNTKSIISGTKSIISSTKFIISSTKSIISNAKNVPSALWSRRRRTFGRQSSRRRFRRSSNSNNQNPPSLQSGPRPWSSLRWGWNPLPGGPTGRPSYCKTINLLVKQPASFSAWNPDCLAFLKRTSHPLST